MLKERRGMPRLYNEKKIPLHVIFSINLRLRLKTRVISQWQMVKNEGILHQIPVNDLKI